MPEAGRLLSLSQIFDALQRAYPRPRAWPQGSWPLSGHFKPVQLEVVVGAILTQNTRWRNVEQALTGLIQAGLTDVAGIRSCPGPLLEGAIRPSGFYRQKARRLRIMAAFIGDYAGDFYGDVGREELLGLEGIGEETADCILLYACRRPRFVIDAYARRLFSRYGILPDTLSYSEMQRRCESDLGAHVRLYQHFHALIVEHARLRCRQRPLCAGCVLESSCRQAGLGRGGES